MAATSLRQKRKASRFLAAAFFFTLAPMASYADTLVDQVIGTSGGKTKPFACFTRAYDAPHLAAHPQQAVTAMQLLAAPTPYSQTGMELRFRATFRTRKGPLMAEGSCDTSADGKSLNCGIECDGAKFDVTAKDASAVLLAVPMGARMWVPNSTAEGNDTLAGPFGADDKLFRLDRAAVTQCLPLANDATERAAMKHAPQ